MSISNGIHSFLHSGGAGDIIYSLPTIKALGGGVLYIKPQNCYNNTCNNFQILKRLLECQDYIDEVIEYPVRYSFFEYDPSIHIDYDLDKFRNVPDLLNTHLIKSHLSAFNITIPEDWSKPWLQVPVSQPMFKDFILINRTLRYHNDSVNWKDIYSTIRDKAFFIGLQEEYKAFSELVGDDRVHYLSTEDLFMTTLFIHSCNALYCNQSVCLTIAQALGKQYYLEVAPGHNNCVMNTENEHLL